MRSTELARRYARAIYDLAVESANQDRVFEELRALDQVFSNDAEIHQFLGTPLIKPNERLEALTKSFKKLQLSDETQHLLLLLAEKDRFAIFHEIVEAYQARSDSANNVCRGTVRSAVALAPAERTRIEETVERVLKKKVILTYAADPSVIGGLIARVGSYTFDDSIASHLDRMSEELKRRTV